METTILLKRSYTKFSANLLFPEFSINKIHDNQTTALVLGILSTDLNYAMLSERKMETNRLINQVIEIAQLLHLDAIVNSITKDRIEKNLNNKDSMQIIIGNTFWEIETKFLVLLRLLHVLKKSTMRRIRYSGYCSNNAFFEERSMQVNERKRYALI